MKHWDRILLIAVLILIVVVNVKVIVDCEGTVVRGLYMLECLEDKQ